MIEDFTTIQHFEVPASILELHNTNADLQVQNKLFRNILIGLAVSVTIIITYHFLKKYREENERQIKKQLTRI